MRASPARAFPIDPEQDREGDEVHQHPGAAVAHERQREPLGRQQAHVHAHVDERLEADPDADALRRERGEMALVQRGLAADGEGTRHDPDEERDHQRHAGEAQFFGDHREQEIGMRFGQVKQLLDACAQADAEPFAATESDERMR